jgi:hypothetical protein
MMLKLAGPALMIATVVLAILACRGYTRQPKEGLAFWRRSLGLVSIGITCLCSVVLVALPLGDRLGFSTTFFSSTMDGVLFFSAVSAVPMSLALKGPARVYALSAATLIVAISFMSTLHLELDVCLGENYASKADTPAKGNLCEQSHMDAPRYDVSSRRGYPDRP